MAGKVGAHFYTISNGVIVVVKVNVAWPLPIAPYKLIITWRSLVLRVAGQHALNTHADCFHVLHRAPALGAEQVETDDAVGVDVRMDRDRSV